MPQENWNVHLPRGKLSAYQEEEIKRLSAHLLVELMSDEIDTATAVMALAAAAATWIAHEADLEKTKDDLDTLYDFMDQIADCQEQRH
jgi:hypothetical protein